MCFYSDTLTLSQIDGFSGRAEINNKMLLKCLRITPLWGKDWDRILLSTFCSLAFLISHVTAQIWLWPLSFQLPIFNKDLMKKLCTQHFLFEAGRAKTFYICVCELICAVCAVQIDIAISCKTLSFMYNTSKMPRMSSHHYLVPSILLCSNLPWPHIKHGVSMVRVPIKFHMSVINQKIVTKSFSSSS